MDPVVVSGMLHTLTLSCLALVSGGISIALQSRIGILVTIIVVGSLLV